MMKTFIVNNRQRAVMCCFLYANYRYLVTYMKATLLRSLNTYKSYTQTRCRCAQQNTENKFCRELDRSFANLNANTHKTTANVYKFHACFFFVLFDARSHVHTNKHAHV